MFETVDKEEPIPLTPQQQGRAEVAFLEKAAATLEAAEELAKTDDQLNELANIPESVAERSRRLEKKLPEAEKAKGESEDPDAVTARSAMQRQAWGDEPFTKNQRDRFPDTTRLAAPKVEVLDLRKPEDLERLNEVYEKAADPVNPRIMLIEEKSQTTKDGNWTVLIKYMQVEFLNI